MTATALLEQLAAIGATVRVVDDRLRIEAPIGTLSADLKSAIAAAKPELLELARQRARPQAHPCACCGLFFFHEPAVTCYWCRGGRTDATRADR